MTLLLLLALSTTRQAIHEKVERVIWNRLQLQHEAIQDLWPHAGHKLFSDFEKAKNCYGRFHLGKVEGCDALLSIVDKDLSKDSSGEIELQQPRYMESSGAQ